MGLEAVILLIVIGIMVVVFVSGAYPVDQTALTGLILLTLIGIIPANRAFEGLASPAVVTIMATFFLGAALRVTGVASIVAGRLHDYTGASETKNILAVMALAGILSAFMTNVAAVAVLLPAIISLARKSGVPSSRLLMPMSFAAVLGGAMTLVGSTTNILISSIMDERGLRAFRFFDFTPFGLSILLGGMAVILLFARKFLPDNSEKDRRRQVDLAEVYQLDERMLSLGVPADSSLVGESLESARLGQILDATVLAVIRGDQKILAPRPSLVVRSEDTLIVRSRLDKLEKLLQFRGVKVSGLSQQDALQVSGKMHAAGLKLVDKAISAWTLKDLDFRNRFGLVVSAIEREGSFIVSNLAKEPLIEGDIVHVIGKSERIQEAASSPYFKQVESEIEAADFLQTHLCIIDSSDNKALAGKTLLESQVGEIVGLTVIGILRDSEPLVSVSPETVIKERDRLIVAGETAHIKRLSMLSELSIGAADSDPELESGEVGLTEVVLSPRSKLFGKTLREISFREKYGMQVVALWRQGNPVRSQIARTKLQFGDALLLQGPREKISLLTSDSDFVFLTEEEAPDVKRDKAPFAVLGLLVMAILSATGLQPVHIAAFSGALVVVIAGAISMQEAYREIEWRVVFLIACLIPIGLAVETSGLAEMVSNGFLGTAGQFGIVGCIIAVSLLASLLSQTLDGTITMVLLAPVCVRLAEQLSISPYPLLMTISVSASIAFLTPFSHKAHLLVMGPGSYKVKDYFRVGWLLTLVSFGLLWLTVLFYYGLL